MKKSEMTTVDYLLEAVGIVSGFIYLGLQIYYGISYGAGIFKVGMNVLAMVLIYGGLSLLQIYPEKVNGLSREICSGKIRKYTIHMVRLIKLIFVEGILVSTICDVMGHQLGSVYGVVIAGLIAVTAIFFEMRIIKIFRSNTKK